MRTIKRTTRFKKDYKRESKGLFKSVLTNELVDTITLLAQDAPLPPSSRDHPLTGEWEGYRDCHIKPDLLLIYRKLGTDMLELARLASHSDLKF